MTQSEASGEFRRETFDYSYALLTRGDKRVSEVDVLVEEYHSWNPYRYVERYVESTKEIETRFFIERQPSNELTLTFSESLHSFRNALDSAVFAYLCQAGVMTHEDVEKACQFPIYTDMSGFNSFAEHNQRQIWPSELLILLRDFQPIFDVEASDSHTQRCYSLAPLQRLTNVSKHRHALLVAPWPSEIMLYTTDGSNNGEFKFLARRPRGNGRVWSRTPENPESAHAVTKTALVIVDDILFPDATITNTHNDCRSVLAAIQRDCRYIVDEIAYLCGQHT